MRLNFRQGLVTFQKDITGKPVYLAHNPVAPSFVNLVVSPTPLVITFANGASDYLATFDRTIENAWGPVVPNVDNYLYWEMDPVSGKVVQGITTILPVFNNLEPAKRPEQSWFNSTNAKMYVWQAQSNKWVERIRLFAGKVPLGNTRDVQMYDAGSQVNMNTASNPGFPMLDSQLRPLRTTTGEFLTTNSKVYVKNTVGTAGVLAVPTNAFIPVKAGENLPAMSLVYFSDNDTVSLASSDPALVTRRTPVGVVQEALVVNEVGALTQYGDITYDQWDWTGHFGQPVYSDNFGKITLTRPKGLLAYRVGFIKNKNTIVFAIDAETEAQVYQADKNAFVINTQNPMTVTDVISPIGERVINITIQPAIANLQDGYMTFQQAQDILDAKGQLVIANQKIAQLDADKANKVHTHIIADVTGLQAALDSKFPKNGNFDDRYSKLDHLHTSVYAPVLHTHTVNDIDGLTARLSSKADRFTHLLPFDRVFERIDQTGSTDVGSGDNLVQALAKKAAATHTHPISQVTGLQAALDGKAATLHDHDMSQVTGLADALDGKANVVHTHTIVQVTGLQAALDNKSNVGHTHSIIEVGGLEARLTQLQTNIDTKTLASLTDTTITSPAAGQSLIWSGSKWVNQVPDFGITMYSGVNVSHFTHGLAFASSTGSVAVATTNQVLPSGKNLTSVNFSASLAKLTDVTITSVATNHILTWDGAKWANKPLVVSNLGLSGLTDTNISATVNPKAYLGWDTTSSKWVDRIVSISDITGFLIGTPASGQTFVYDAGQSSFVSRKLNISELGNVNTAGAVANQVLGFDGTNWKPVNASSGGSSSLAGLSDVTITSPSSGQMLSWNGTIWRNLDPSSIQGLKLSQLSDVAVGTPTNGQILGWNGLNAWTPRNAPLGLPTGGSTGQILSKTSATDGAAQWIVAPTGLPNGGNVGQYLAKTGAANGQAGWQNAPIGMPAGGTAGQALIKLSAIDGAAGWQNLPSGLPDGGTKGQVLAKKTDTDSDAEWITMSVADRWMVYGTNALASAALSAGSILPNAYVDIIVDSRYGNRRTLNQVVGGVITFMRYADVESYVGSGPGEIPTNSLLGKQAFADEVGVTQVYQAPYTSKPGDVWREFTNNTTTVLKFHGFDGVIRTRSETWT